MGLFRLAARVGCLRGGATRPLEEWPHIRLRVKLRRRTEPGLQALWHFIRAETQRRSDFETDTNFPVFSASLRELKILETHTMAV